MPTYEYTIVNWIVFISAQFVTIFPSIQPGSASLSSPITFVPSKGWINDPNGLVYIDGTYHLFYQYNAYSNVHTNLSWGHSTSHDLVHWYEKGVALPYNSQTGEMIFSGSAVYDKNNTSGFGTHKGKPLVAIFTTFYSLATTLANGVRVEAGTQSQSIAYSNFDYLDYHFYKNNPVIANPPAQYSQEFKAFRDPKVFWYEPGQKWVMVVSLADRHKLLFYSSKNLIRWILTGEFEDRYKTKSGQWECPDLFQMVPLNTPPTTSHNKWILLLSENPRGTSANSNDTGMVYFVGHFDGLKFTTDFTHDGKPRWLDYGSDFYAGYTWNNLPYDARFGRPMIGWINNWRYADNITRYWRGGLGLVRTLHLVQDIKTGRFHLIQQPIEQIKLCRTNPSNYVIDEIWRSKYQGIEIRQNKSYELIVEVSHDTLKLGSFSFLLVQGNNAGKCVVAFNNIEARITYDARTRTIMVEKIDTGDQKSYVLHTAPYLYSHDRKIRLHIFIDDNTLTIFINGGEIVFTELLVVPSRPAGGRLFCFDSKSAATELEMRPRVTRWLLECNKY